MQIDKTSISSESPSFPVEPQLSLGSRANHILLQNDTERQSIIKKLDKAKTTSRFREVIQHKSRSSE